MSKSINYPTPEKIIEFNILALNILKVKKADKPEVLSHLKLLKIMESCEKFKGDIYDKAAELMIGLVTNDQYPSPCKAPIAQRFLSGIALFFVK